MLPELFIKYSKIFKENGFKLYMVGGSSRDFLLNRYFDDYDFVTDAVPSEIKGFLNEADYTFAKFGSIKIKDNGCEIDITTLRSEGEYLDNRHPSKITFIKDIQEDSKRRDFTINAIYIDDFEIIYDFYGGLDDLKNHVIRFIGDSDKRLEEDPLRILRAERFAEDLDFKIEKQTQEAIERHRSSISLLNKDKIKLELNKCKKRK